MHKTEAKTDILIIFTGGTIGSTCKEGVIDVCEENSLLLSLFNQQYPNELYNFSTLSPLNILSENLELQHLELLIKNIEANLTKYDGIIVTHGSDTLAFSANLLALYFNTITIPLFLVSSQKPLENAEANGLLNFESACRYIHEKKEAGVFVAYKNEQEVLKIHQGSSLVQSFQLSSRFESLENREYMQYEKNIFTQITALKNLTHAKMSLNLDDNVEVLHPSLTLNYDSIHLHAKKRYLHTTYHSGTCNEKVLTFIKKCTSNKIEISFCGIKKKDAHYASTQKLIESGAQIYYDDSFEMAYAKMLLRMSVE